MVFRIEPEDTLNPVLRNEIKSDDHDDALRGGVDRAAAPENKAVMAELSRRIPKTFRQKLNFRNAEFLKEFQSKGLWISRVEGGVRRPSTDRVYTYYKHYVDLPAQ